jgi:hypothetical protein
MKAIFAFLYAIYDFFVGDWRLFIGAMLTTGIVLALLFLPALSTLKFLAAWVFPIGLLLTLVATVLLIRGGKTS